MNPASFSSTEAQGYGAFRIDDLHLALPMQHLREVLPVSAFHALPGQHRWVCGGIMVRGVTIPVVNLKALCGQPFPLEAQQCIVVVAHRNRLTGLLATAVGGLYHWTPEQLHKLHSTDPVARLAFGGVKPDGQQTATLVISPDQLFDLPDLPSVQDPEPHRQLDASNQPSEHRHDRLAQPKDQSLLLMQARGLLYAINPSDIETTIARPQVQASDLGGGHYKGNVMHRGRLIPAVSLSEYLGMGLYSAPYPHSHSENQQAVVIRYQQGAMALLLDRILDIVRVNAQALICMPEVDHIKASLINQLVRASDLYPGTLDARHYHVLRAEGLQNDPMLQDLARVLHLAEDARTQGESQASTTMCKAGTGARVILFDMDQTYAMPIDQVTEVLPYRHVIAGFAPSLAFKGYMTHRQQAIPVYDMAQALGMHKQPLDSDSNVLVMDIQGQAIGYAVGRLRAIETAQWSPTLPVLGARRHDRGSERSSQELVEVPLQGRNTLVELLDVRTVASTPSPEKVNPEDGVMQF